MDIQNANTEPLYRFLRSHEDLSRSARMLLEGITELKAQRPDVGARFEEEFERAQAFIAQMGIVRVVTALEDFCRGVKAERDRYRALGGGSISGKQGTSNDKVGFFRKLYEEFGWPASALSELPLFEYFAWARNCIVHRSGRASKGLNQYAESASLKRCFDDWNNGLRKGRRLPPLPLLTPGDELPFVPKHAILASEVCRRIAVDGNQRLVNLLGIEGIVNMAAYHSILSDGSARANARKKTPEATLNHILVTRYRVKLRARKNEAVAELVRMGRWGACCSAFSKRQE